MKRRACAARLPQRTNRVYTQTGSQFAERHVVNFDDPTTYHLMFLMITHSNRIAMGNDNPLISKRLRPKIKARLLEPSFYFLGSNAGKDAYSSSNGSYSAMSGAEPPAAPLKPAPAAAGCLATPPASSSRARSRPCTLSATISTTSRLEPSFA